MISRRLCHWYLMTKMKRKYHLGVLPKWKLFIVLILSSLLLHDKMLNCFTLSYTSSLSNRRRIQCTEKCFPYQSITLFAQDDDTTELEDSTYNTISNSRSLLEFLTPTKTCNPDQMSGTDLAYVGDVVYELFVRSRHVWPSRRTSDLQNQVVGLVRGECELVGNAQLKELFFPSQTFPNFFFYFLKHRSIPHS